MKTSQIHFSRLWFLMTDLLDLFDIQNLCMITRELLAPGYWLLIQVIKT